MMTNDDQCAAQWVGPGAQIQRYRVRFLVMCWSLFHNLLISFGVCWEVFGYSGVGLAWIWDVSDKIGNIENVDFQKCLGVFFPSRGGPD